jgi:hypothetical protein
MNMTIPGLKRLAGNIDLDLFSGWSKVVFLAGSSVLLAGCQLAEMAQFGYANATATHRWLDDTRSTTLRFELIDDHIIVPVSVNASEPLNFVLDSGAAATVILESQSTNALLLEMGGKLSVSGVGTGPSPEAFVVADTDLSLGSVRLEGLSVVYLPLSSVPFFNNLDEVYFDGVIGAPFFERFVVEIDYDRQLISFSEPGSVAARAALASAGWEELPLQIQSGLPYLATQISTATEHSVAVKLLVDTGYRGPVSLTPQTHAEIDEPLEYFAIVSQGLSGDVHSRVAISEHMAIGSFQLDNLPVSYAVSGGESDGGSNGLIGNEVLSRFNLIFDYPNERMLVTPSRRFEVPINADRSGLLIRSHQQGAVVKSIGNDSAGDRLDIRIDDIITSIDSRPVTPLNIAELKGVLASDRETVSVCWLSGERPHCGDLFLVSRFDQHDRR